MPPTPSLLEQRAVVSALLDQGRLQECEPLARALVEGHPDDATSWNLLGVCLAVAGRFEDALAPLQQTAALDPRDADAHKLVGDVLHRLGRLAEAADAYARSIALAPDNVDVRVALGNTLAALGRPADAERHFRHAVALAPQNVAAHTSLGAVLRDLGRSAEAEASCRRAIELKPGAFRAHNNLGNALKDLGRLDEAEASYRRAIERKPDHANAHLNLANLLTERGRLDEAEASCRRAIELLAGAPVDTAGAYNVLGILLRRAKRLTEAKQALLHATELAPGHAEAHNSLGNLLRELGDQAASEAELRRALELAPDYHQARSNLLFAVHHRAHTATESLELARDYGLRVSGGEARPSPSFRCEPDPKRLRVGLVSGDLHEHVVAYFLEGVLARLDPTRIELVAYPTRVVDDARARRIRGRCAQWKPLVGLDDDAAARAIRDDGVHVLLDLAGHTAHNRLPLFARRAAPVQASWLGYFDTTGVAEIDYVLADEVGVPRDRRARFTERVWYLPDTRLCFTPPDDAPATSPLPALASAGAAGTPSVTFGCVQELAKLNDGVLAAWSRVLQRLPHARLRLQSWGLADAAVRAELGDRLRARGIAPDRVELRGPVPRDQYLAAFAAIDVALDTFPYPGGTTTCEALWMGVPTITLAGDDLLARQGASLLTAAGLADWVANDEDGYVDKAVAFASDARALTELASLRGSLRARVAVSPLFDAERFARNLEAALFGMWRARAH